MKSAVCSSSSAPHGSALSDICAVIALPKSSVQTALCIFGDTASTLFSSAASISPTAVTSSPKAWAALLR